MSSSRSSEAELTLMADLRREAGTPLPDPIAQARLIHRIARTGRQPGQMVPMATTDLVCALVDRIDQLIEDVEVRDQLVSEVLRDLVEAERRAAALAQQVES